MKAIPMLVQGTVLRFAADATVVFDPRAGMLQARRGAVRLALNDLCATVGDLVTALRNGINATDLEGWRQIQPEEGILRKLLDCGIVHVVVQVPPGGRSTATLEYLAAYTSEPMQALAAAQAANVVVVGLGGLGCEVVRHLAALGVRRLVCVDHDRVELSNLNRQLCYAPADVGRWKVEAIRDYLDRHHPETQIATHQKFVRSEADLLEALAKTQEPPNLILCCADEPVGQVELACLGAARRLGASFGFTAMQVGRGYWGLIVSDEAMMEAEGLFQAASELNTRAKVGAVRGAASWENSLLAAHFCDALVRRLAALRPGSQLDCMRSVEFLGPASTTLTDFRHSKMARGGQP
ncbi:MULTISPECIES: HesA/MoeB/ThiF family protein [unclassified Bradyrhizobium]|uniref:HesA/MoeB/ThiF family protein n=1 Tax=unclassified Bradyrhizobium TaxID=2631580 RepID=UPI0029171121|nr:MULTISPECIES: ThiF family adenylyltransferase [unclassified Bradyrhizobium]